MSLRAISWAMEVACPSPAAKLVLLVLCDAHNGHTGDCYPSLNRIIASTGLSEAGVKKSIRAMEAIGMLKREVELDGSGRTRGVRYILDIGGRGHTVTPPCDEGEGAHSNPSEGAHSNPPRGHTVTPHREPERRTGKELEKTRTKAKPADEFEGWYEHYPHKIGRGAALKAFEAARKKVGLQILVDGLQAYIRTKPPDTDWCHPATWLNQERWADEPAAPAMKRGSLTDAAINLQHQTRRAQDEQQPNIRLLA
jgi:hypothetical protein